MLNDHIWNDVANHCGRNNMQLDQLNPVEALECAIRCT